MGNLTDIRTGSILKINGEPYLVVQNLFMRKDASKPSMQTKCRNLITGKMLNEGFSSGKMPEFADVERRQCQYLYKDGQSAHFMDNESFEQFELPLDQVEENLKFLNEDTEVYITFYEERPIGVQAPVKVTIKVIETPPGVKGDTATGGTKPAKLETGATVTVPLFIKNEEKIIVNTDTGEYVSRAGS